MIPGILAAGAVATPGGDPYWANVVSLLHFNGTDGSTTFTDETGVVWTGSGNAQLDTDQKKFGSASLGLDGSGDYLTTPDSADFEASGDMTVEAWVYPGNSGSLRSIIGKKPASTPFSAWAFSKVANNQIQVAAWDGSGLVVNATGTTALSVGVWYHVAFSRSGPVWRVFVNGILEAEETQTSAPTENNTDVVIGRDLSNSGRDWLGNIDELRVTKGIARYTSNFTPPTAPFPNGP